MKDKEFNLDDLKRMMKTLDDADVPKEGRMFIDAEGNQYSMDKEVDNKTLLKNIFPGLKL